MTSGDNDFFSVFSQTHICLHMVSEVVTLSTEAMTSSQYERFREGIPRRTTIDHERCVPDKSRLAQTVSSNACVLEKQESDKNFMTSQSHYHFTGRVP